MSATFATKSKPLDDDKPEQKQLVVNNMGLVPFVARQFYRNREMPPDAISEGHVGLVYAAVRFDPSRGVKFSTYAAYWIRAFVGEYMIRNFGAIRFDTPKNRKVFYQITRLRGEMVDDKGALAEHFGMKQSEFDLLHVRLRRNDVSLDAEWYEGKKREIPSGDDDPEGISSAAELAEILRDAVERLPPRWRQLVEARYFSGSGEPRTFESIGEEWGMSRQRVQQLESRALRRLRRLLEPVIGGL